MGKKKSKNKANIRKQSDADLLRAAELACARGQWKEAVTAYKELNKRHPGEYDDALTGIQVQRWEGFVTRKLYESADQLFANLRDQLPPERLESLKLRRAVLQGDREMVAKLSWKNVESRQADGRGFGVLPLEYLIFSDSEPPASLRSNPEVETLLAVRSGLQAICRGDTDQLDQASAAISRKSLLAHWKLILRALDAWYSGRDEEISACLERLGEPGPVSGHIVRSLRKLCEAEATEAGDELAGIFALHDVAASDRIPELRQVDAYLHEGKTVQAFELGALKFGFYRAERTLVEQVVCDHFANLFKVGRDDLAECIEKKMQGSQNNPNWFPYAQAIFERWDLPCNCLSCCHEFAVSYFSALTNFAVPKAVQARARVHFAELVMSELHNLDNPQDEVELRWAIDHLREAWELDPEQHRAGMLLHDALLLAKDESGVDTLLSELAERHSDNAHILHCAGARNVKRGEVDRGLEQLERAMAIDPHLPSLREKYIRVLLPVVHADYREGHLNSARARLATLQDDLQTGKDLPDYWLDRELMRLRELEFELSYGDGSADLDAVRREIDRIWKGRERMREAFEHLFTELLGSPERQSKSRATRKAFFGKDEVLKDMPPEHLLHLLEIDESVCAETETPPEWSDELREFYAKYRLHVVPERLDGILRILWKSIPNLIQPEPLIEVCKRWSKVDRHHPQLKLLVIAARLELDSSCAEDCPADVNQALATAAARNDSIALKKGRQLHKQIAEIMERQRSSYDGGTLDSGPAFDDGEPGGPQPEFDIDAANMDLVADEETREGILNAFDSLFEIWIGTRGGERKKFEREVINNMDSKIAKRMLGLFRQKEAELTR